MGLKTGTIRKNGLPARQPGRIAKPKPPRGPSRRKGPRPHVWLTGPDKFMHDMYTPWQRSKAQAVFRKEEFLLTFDEYYTLWKPHWHQRGRDGDNMCMTRDNPDGAWSIDNCVIMTRREQIIKSVQDRK
jgi:hypothetical protein